MQGEVSRVSPNEAIARSLLQMCNARLEIAKSMPRKYPALVAEVYYEVVKEQVTALLALDGYKSYSHKCLISFIEEFYRSEFTPSEISLVDRLRVIRNDVGYRGISIGGDFLERNEATILVLIQKLSALAEKKLKKRG